MNWDWSMVWTVAQEPTCYYTFKTSQCELREMTRLAGEKLVICNCQEMGLKVTVVKKPAGCRNNNTCDQTGHMDGQKKTQNKKATLVTGSLYIVSTGAWTTLIKD